MYSNLYLQIPYSQLFYPSSLKFPHKSSLLKNTHRQQVFPDSSVGKEFTCSAGDPGSIPGSGRSTGKGNGYPLQYSWASLVSHLVKNPPAMWETWIPSLGWEDPLERGMTTYSSILAWEIPWTEEPVRLQSTGLQESDRT